MAEQLGLDQFEPIDSFSRIISTSDYTSGRYMRNDSFI